MAKDNFGNLSRNVLSTFNTIYIFTTEISLNKEYVTLKIINDHRHGVICSVTLIVIIYMSFICIFAIISFCLKVRDITQNNYKEKMNSENTNIEKNIVSAFNCIGDGNFTLQCNDLFKNSVANNTIDIENISKTKSVKSQATPISSNQLPNASNYEENICSKSFPFESEKPPLPNNSDLCTNSPESNVFNFDLLPNKDHMYNYHLHSPLMVDNIAYYTPKTCNSQGFSEYNTCDKSIGLSMPARCQEKSETCNIECSVDFDGVVNSPESCEYYSAKSTIKTPEYFKFPESQELVTDNMCEDSIKKTKQWLINDREDDISTVFAKNLNIDCSTIMHRRARLKSISLDSTIIDFMDDPLPTTTVSASENASVVINNNSVVDAKDIDKRKKLRNLKSLTLNLNHKDENLQHNISVRDCAFKTPTLIQSKQKAISLDLSDDCTPHFKFSMNNTTIQNISASVPNTPKKFIKKNARTFNQTKRNNYNNMSFPESLNIFQMGECYSANRSFCQRHTHVHQSSFKTKINRNDEFFPNGKLNEQQILLGATNLHHFKSSLSVSNNNLKTLPEVMSLNDFNVSSNKMALEPFIDSNDVQCRKSILQRRGSNQSLTISLDSNLRSSQCLSLQGSVGNLSNYCSLSASNYNICEHSLVYPKRTKCLFQSRVSNQSLTLNLNNKFSSQSLLDNSLSCNNKKGLLERRNSNTSLTLNLSTNSQNAFSHWITDDADSGDAIYISNHRFPEYHSPQKSVSTECLLERLDLTCDNKCSTRVVFGSADNIRYSDVHRIESAYCVFEDQPRLITTRPISPRADSEDFRTHLANLEILRSASNVLCRRQLKELNIIFERRYSANKNENCEVEASEKAVIAEDSFCKDIDYNADNITKNQKSSSLNNTCSNELKHHYKTEQTVVMDNKSIDTLSNIDKLFSTSEVLVSNNLEHQYKTLLLSLHREFWNLPNNFQDKPTVYGSQTKNRYNQILPNEHSRVVLNEKTPCNTEGYINANYIKGYDNLAEAYIVTQGPLSHTTYDFWSMVYQNASKESSASKNANILEVSHLQNPNYQKIVMLTDLAESNYQKCSPYFPMHNGESMEFFFDGNNILSDNSCTSTNVLDRASKYSVYEVSNAGVIFKHGYSLRRLFVKRRRNLQNENRNQDCLEVFHYWFEGWPDHKSPDDVQVLLDMCLHILDDDCFSEFDNDYLVISDKNPAIGSDSKYGSCAPDMDSLQRHSNISPFPIIHCSAGIGRTGCLVAVLNGVKQLRDTQKVDVLGIVSAMRLSRGGMVQNSEQYELVHRALCAYEQRISQDEDKFK